jgi:hypothetical protein
MAITYHIEIEKPLLRVTASGKDENLEQVIEYGMAVVNAAFSSGCTKVLCNEQELEYSLGTIDTFESARFISEAAPGVAKVVIVCREEQIEDAALWETVAINRGLTVKVFKQLAEAEKWLIVSSPETVK